VFNHLSFHHLLEAPLEELAPRSLLWELDLDLPDVGALHESG
jgi:hypothetical protein